MSRAVMSGRTAGPGLGRLEVVEPTDTVTELLAALISPVLRRRDQRRRAEQYVRGLLSVDGRKSVRRIASSVGGGAAEQGLHHFVAHSTWEWNAMRERLARHVQAVMPPQAWVVQPVSIPKVGVHSVGVHRRFVPHLGQADSGQQAFGVWFAAEDMSVPVSWRLHLPGDWVHDEEHRRRADIPESVVEETLEECASASVLGAVLGWRVPRAPVVMSAAGPDVGGTMQRHRAAGQPLLLRVSGTTGLAVADPSMPGHGAGRVSAHRIAASVRALRRPVGWPVPGGAPGESGRSLVVAVRVVLPAPGPRASRADAGRPTGLLLAEWHDPDGPPAEFWLTEMADTPVPALVRLARLAERVAGDFGTLGDRVGLRDFEGRSFTGWHRHVTLASIAYAALALGGRDPWPAPEGLGGPGPSTGFGAPVGASGPTGPGRVEALFAPTG
ncbi:transposase [Streptomyces sp. J15]|uniref:Transposase n=1 Tax=Streptomyces pakalii TaxID=3036494 RepID=A0ABT7DEY1_9ACTN|nr:transposase [Streptomyces pakalii]MDJ1644384.1 transposase [Streptomyces pakalii]